MISPTRYLGTLSTFNQIVILACSNSPEIGIIVSFNNIIQTISIVTTQRGKTYANSGLAIPELTHNSITLCLISGNEMSLLVTKTELISRLAWFLI